MASVSRQGSSPHTRGAPSARWEHSSSMKDHPRIRGEHATMAALIVAAVRIIPAYAGSTAGASTRRRPRGGSSPHTRGARVAQSIQAIQARIIPAYAGSTPDWRGSIHREKDHPRIRGEHRHKGEKAAFQTGSSPHTRGARQRPAHAGDDHGIIPAYAGSTCK